MAVATVTADGIKALFQLLGLGTPSQKRIDELLAGKKTYTQIRDGLLWYIANSDPNDDLTSAADVLSGIIDQQFAAAGIEDAGIEGETEEQRLERIVNEILSGQRTLGEVSQTIAGFATTPTGGGDGITDVSPVDVGGSVIPAGGELVRIKAPAGSDEPWLYYINYTWRGVTLAFEVGGPDRLNELFGGVENFDGLTTLSQAQFDEAGFVLAGSIDSELGATESIGSRIERENRALGLEDLPSWLADSPDALVLVATSTAEEWSSGRLWKELSTTTAFTTRFGTAWSRYFTEGKTIADAVNELVADEDALRDAIRPWTTGDVAIEFLQGMLNEGWTAGAAARVLEVAESLASDPESLALANFILEASGLDTLDEVGFVNALAGFGPQETIEALNTATAARALDEAGIDLPDETVNLLMDLVDTSDRLLTAESWRGLAQELSFNLIRFSHELDQGKLGAVEPDLIAAAFGRESPTGKSSGEVIDLLARFERDRRAASGGYSNVSGFLDEQGRLRIQGLSGL